MSSFFRDDFLRRLRNEVPWQKLFAQLDWPHKDRQGQLGFLCPRCHEYRSAINPRTHLARCFYCQTNFNPIDMTIAVRGCDFVEAVSYLEPLLPPQAATRPGPGR
jgi:hypothetical protein